MNAVWLPTIPKRERELIGFQFQPAGTIRDCWIYWIKTKKKKEHVVSDHYYNCAYIGFVAIEGAVSMLPCMGVWCYLKRCHYGPLDNDVSTDSSSAIRASKWRMYSIYFRASGEVYIIFLVVVYVYYVICLDNECPLQKKSNEYRALQWAGFA